METARDMSVASLALLLQCMGWLFQSCMDLTMWDLTWLLPYISVVFITFRSRSFLVASLSAFWKSLENDVNTFCQRHFPPPPSFVLPPNWTAISAEDVGALNRFADAIQRRLNSLRNRLDACGTLQEQLAEAQRALADERISHKATVDCLQYQNNALADAEATIELLRAQLAAEESEIGENTQTGEVEEIEEEAPAADEIISPPMVPQSEVTDPQPQTADGSAETIALLTKELEELQAEYNTLEDDRDTLRDERDTLREECDTLREDDRATLRAERDTLEKESDTWREACEEFELKAVDLADELKENVEKAARDKKHHDRRVEALETQLGIETSSREEAQATVHTLRDQKKELRDELREVKAQHESLQTAYQAGERDREEKEVEYTSLQAERDRLQMELIDLFGGATSALNASAPEFVPSAPSTIIDQPTESLETTRPTHSWADAVEDNELGFFDLPNFDIDGSVVEDPFLGADPFPELDGPESTPAPGPGQARNPHVQKLNEEVKRREWRAQSGMAGSAEEEEGDAGPEDVLNDMFDRQVKQALKFAPIRCARGGMFGALNDVPSPVESPSGTPIMLGGYEVTRGEPSAAGSASEVEKEEEKANADGSPLDGVEGTEGEKPVEEEGPREEPKAEEEEGPREEPKAEEEEGTQEEPKAEEEEGPQEQSKTEEEEEASSTIDSPPSPSAAPNVPQHTSPVTKLRLPSNYYPQLEQQPKTHDERVGDAIVDAVEQLARERGLGSLRESRWAVQETGADEGKKKKKKIEETPRSENATVPETPSSAIPRTSRSEAAAAADHREPSPQQQQQQEEEAPPSNPPSTQKTHAEQVGDALADFINAQAAHSTPLTGSIWANTNTPASVGNDAARASSTSTNNNNNNNLRGRGGGHEGIRGGPLTPSPGPNQRGRGRGRGRGGQTPTSASGPVRATARGGSSNAASDSFRRLQERMKRERGE